MISIEVEEMDALMNMATQLESIKRKIGHDKSIDIYVSEDFIAITVDDEKSEVHINNVDNLGWKISFVNAKKMGCNSW